MTQSGDDTYLTAQEAMVYLGISRNTLDKLADKSDLTKYKQRLSRNVLFKKSELDALKEIEPVQDEEDN